MSGGGRSKLIQNRCALALAAAFLIATEIIPAPSVQGAEPAPAVRIDQPAAARRRAIFSGENRGERVSLWVTDGTTAGTRRLRFAGIPDSPADFTVLGDKLLFIAGDPSGRDTIWVTDGTAAGTAELLPASTGPFGVAPPLDLTPLGGVVVFAGINAQNHRGLWVTNGTAVGTHEIKVRGASPAGPFANCSLAANFARLGGKALFAGQDSTGNETAWATDGTTAGTGKLRPRGSPLACPVRSACSTARRCSRGWRLGSRTDAKIHYAQITTSMR